MSRQKPDTRYDVEMACRDLGHARGLPDNVCHAAAVLIDTATDTTDDDSVALGLIAWRIRPHTLMPHWDELKQLALDARKHGCG